MLAEVLWIDNTFKVHKQRDHDCISLFKPCVIGRHVFDTDRTVFLSVATCWDLLNMFRALAASNRVKLMPASGLTIFGLLTEKDTGCSPTSLSV